MIDSNKKAAQEWDLCGLIKNTSDCFYKHIGLDHNRTKTRKSEVILEKWEI